MKWFVFLVTLLLIAGLVAIVLRKFRKGDGADELPEAESPLELDKLQERIGYRFRDTEILRSAVTHTSFANEAGNGVEHNETLEFLGDAVIELITSVILINHPKLDREGKMSKVRAMVVNKNSLAEMAEKLKLGDALRMSHGERSSGGKRKKSLLANAYEAVVGAVFLDGGFELAQSLFHEDFEKRIEDALSGKLKAKDYKTSAQEVSQAKYGCVPTYVLISAEGPDHAKTFTTEFRIHGNILGTGTGNSKKESEQKAAKSALVKMEEDG